MEILFQVLLFLGWLAGLLAASFCLLLYFDHRAWAREYYAPGDRAGRPGFNLGATIVKMKTCAKLGHALILSAFLLSLPIGFVLQTATALCSWGHMWWQCFILFCSNGLKTKRTAPLISE